MFMTILTVAGALAQAYGAPPAMPVPVTAAAPPATAAAPLATPTGRSLKDLPNTAITYYDVPGKSQKAIEKSLKALLADPASKDITRLFTWNVGAQITQRKVGQNCTVQGVKPTLKTSVHLPRLSEESEVPAKVVANWRTYVAGIESDAAANLWFINDRLSDIDKSMVGVSCDQATPAWNAALEKLKLQLSEFAAQRAATAAAAAAPAKEPAKKD